jgi:hypothetical protein
VRDSYLKNRRYKIYNGHPPGEAGESISDTEKDDFTAPIQAPEKAKK